jgi:hypothetical protein
LDTRSNTLNRALLPLAICTTGYMRWCFALSTTAFVSSAFVRLINAKELLMASHLPVIDDDGEVGDLSEVDPALFKPFSSLPDDLQTVLRGRGKQKSPTKVAVTLRYSPEVIDAFRATGKGWQTRMDEALKDWLRGHSAA